MMYDVTGDILLSKAAVIVQGVAPNDDFNKGLAMSLREHFPSLYKDFRHFCHTAHPKEGTVWVWSGMGNGRTVSIVNLFTHETPEHAGDHAGKPRLSHVNHALRELRKLLQKEQIESVALPRIACGLGGLQWEEVRALIEQHLGDLDIPVYVYSTFSMGIEAKEPHQRLAIA